MRKLLIGGAGASVVAGGLFFASMLSSPPAPASFLSLSSGASASCSTPQYPVTGHTVLTGPQVAQAAWNAGFRGDNLVIAVAVAHAESGWNPDVRNGNTNGSTDFGLWEINSVHADILSHGDWSDPDDNAVMAFQIFSDAGQRWSPWVTYWSGAYLKFMPEAQQAVATLSGTSQQGGGCDAVSGGALADPGPGPQGSDGLRPRAENVKAFGLAQWGCGSNPQPCVSSVGGFARRNIAGTGVLSDHATGRAVDLMLPADYRSAAAQALGREMANFWAANLSRFGGHYVIFNKQIFTSESGKWMPYTHPSGQHNDTLDHINHVHVSVL